MARCLSVLPRRRVSSGVKPVRLYLAISTYIYVDMGIHSAHVVSAASFQLRMVRAGTTGLGGCYQHGDLREPALPARGTPDSAGLPKVPRLLLRNVDEAAIIAVKKP